MNRSLKLNSFAMILATTVMLTAGFAEAATAKAEKPLKATFNVVAPTTVGNTTLQPGTYDVKISPSSGDSGDPIVEFSRFSYVLNGSDGVSPEDDVVVTVHATAKDLHAPAASTGLIASGDNDASGFEIRGRSTEYSFNSSTAPDLAAGN